jgi:hypothetical protein
MSETIEGYVLSYKHDGRYQKLALGLVPAGDPIAYLKIEAEDVPTFQRGTHVTLQGLTKQGEVKGIPFYDRLQEKDTTALMKNESGELEKVEPPEISSPNWDHRLELAALTLLLVNALNKPQGEVLQLIQDLALKLYASERDQL